mgnify:CR=1 FL=1
MVQIIAGAKGKGKTKYLLDMANTAVKEAKGSVVYLDKNKTSKRCSKIRLRVSDLFFEKGYDSSWNYIDFYNIALGSFMVIKGE